MFKNRTVNPMRLGAFGFVAQGRGYVYSALLLDGMLAMTVAVTEDGVVTAEVIDTLTREAYTAFLVAGACGAFVGRVRQEYENVLAAVREQCFDRDTSWGDCAEQIIEYVRAKYGDVPEYLWPKFPGNAVLRRKDNAKWYAALLRLSERKLGLSSDTMIDIVDLRSEPQSLSALIDGVGYFPGFHMNKKHWFTIRLDGSVPVGEIFSRIDASYEIAGNRR